MICPRLLKCLEGLLPDTLFFETPEEALNDPVLFRRVGRIEFLSETIVSTGLAKAPPLEDQPLSLRRTSFKGAPLFLLVAQDAANIGRAYVGRSFLRGNALLKLVA